MPRLVVLVLTIALLVATVAAGLALARVLIDADDDGSVLAGLTYEARDGFIYTHMIDESDGPVPLAGPDARAFSWSTDGTRFSYDAWAGDEGPVTLMVRGADGSDPIAVSEPFAMDDDSVRRHHAWSPDGSWILHAAGEPASSDRCVVRDSFCGMRIWSAPTDGSEPARAIGDPGIGARAPVWTPDGETIIFAGSTGSGWGSDYGIYRMDADGSDVERVGNLTGYSFSLDRLAISPDGTTVAVGNGDIHLVDLATARDMLIAGEDANEFAPHWSPDGSMIAFTKQPWSQPAAPQAMLYDVASGEVIPLDMPLVVLAWSPDGRSILAGSPEGTLTMVDVTDPTAPVATQVEGIADAAIADAAGAGWRPLP